jgi:CubicO group peptidase (beta-lactamase class C family)
MHVASLSKIVTAIAMTKLLNDQGMSYDTPIIDFLPGYWSKGPDVNLITFRQLMDHTSGLAFDNTTSGTDFEFMKEQIEAGTTHLGQYSYQNMNYGLCRILIATINGNIPVDWVIPLPSFNDQVWDCVTLAAYQAFVNANVFSPSGVTGATLYHEPADALAYNFPVSGPGWNSGDLTTLAGGTGWHMTLDQVLAVMSTFRRSGTIMSPADAQTMLDDGFGLNWTVPTPLGTYYAKIGGWSGDGGRMEQSIAFFLPQQMEFVLFVNSPVGFPAPGQLLSYGDNGTAGNVSDPVVVGFGGWEVFKFLFGGRNLAVQDRIYAVNQNGQLLSYGDNGTTGNVSDPVIVGFGGWEVFEFVFAGTNLDGQNRIYAVVSSAVTLNGVQYQKGQLLSYVDNGQPGNVSDPVIVGFDDWTDFKFLFGGTNLQDQPCIYGVWALPTPTPPPGESLYLIVSAAYTNNIVTIGTGQ